MSIFTCIITCVEFKTTKDACEDSSKILDEGVRALYDLCDEHNEVSGMYERRQKNTNQETSRKLLFLKIS